MRHPQVIERSSFRKISPLKVPLRFHERLPNATPISIKTPNPCHAKFSTFSGVYSPPIPVIEDNPFIELFDVV
jgi:hypothetical protein